MNGSDEEIRIRKISELHGLAVRSTQRLSGGSINAVYKLDTANKSLVIKINDSHRFPGMFSAEKEGLETLGSSGAILVPEVIAHGALEGAGYLILGYIEEGSPGKDFWSRFGRNLASLHRVSAPSFGFPHSNYIGSLPQYNSWSDHAGEFYLEQRLKPQFQLAVKNGFDFGDLDAFFKRVLQEIPDEAPALIHGDLWSGNYLVDVEGQPWLIDPAVSFGPREMDLAMMQLFGGFPDEVFKEYDRSYPLQKGFLSRVPLWQLYYLLVHLNIFGSTYLPGVKEKITQFS